MKRTAIIPFIDLSGGAHLQIRRLSNRAFSFVEMMVVVGFIGLVAAVGIPMISSIVTSSNTSLADKSLSDLNEAVLKFNQSNWELYLAPVPGDITDETAIIRSLQYRSSTSPSPGAPYLSPQLTLTSTSLASKYRAYWNGRMFEMYSLGADGTGVDLMRLTQSGTAATFATGYKPVGAP